MYCLGCGCKLDLGAKFCSHCGKPTAMLNANGTGKIIVARPNSFFGFAIPFDVYVDNSYLGNLTNGTTLSCDTSLGIHDVVIKSTEPDVNVDVTLDENQRQVTIEIVAQMGLIAAKPGIKNVYYN